MAARYTAAGDYAAIQRWASWIEDGQAVTMSGVTVLRFDQDDHVVDHRDCWNQADTHQALYTGC